MYTHNPFILHYFSYSVFSKPAAKLEKDFAADQEKTDFRIKNNWAVRKKSLFFFFSDDDKGGWRRSFEFETKVAVDEDAGKAICCDGKTAEPPLLLLDVDDDACNSSGSGEEEEGRFLINVDSSSSFILSSPVECNNTDDGGGPFSSSLFPALFDMIVFDSFWLLERAKGDGSWIDLTSQDYPNEGVWDFSLLKE